jgi:hypothetical protein
MQRFVEHFRPPIQIQPAQSFAGRGRATAFDAHVSDSHLNMAVRMEANWRGIAIEAVTSSVSLDRTQADAAENCPVCKTLSKALAFRAQPVQ